MAYTSISAILKSEAFEEWVEQYVDEYGMGFVQEYYPDDALYSFDEFDDLLADMKPWDIMRATQFGELSLNDDYFGFNGYGNLMSVSEYRLHQYLWDIIRYNLDEFHEYLMCYYRDEYEEEFYKNFPLVEEVSGIETTGESEEDFYERSYSRIVEEETA